MNKLLIAIFDNEASADAGLQALRHLHAAGDITLYGTGVVVKDAEGRVSVRAPHESGLVGTATGLAVGSVIGLLGGPVGVAVGAVAGTVLGAVRDFWASGVALDFIEDAESNLKPGKVALVAELEEERVAPIDAALEGLGGRVSRCSRNAVAQVQFEHDMASLKSEIRELKTEAGAARGDLKTRLQGHLAQLNLQLDTLVHAAGLQVDRLKEEADTKAEALQQQWTESSAAVQRTLEERMQRVKGGYHTRGLQLAQAWNLAKEALTP